TGVLCLCPGQAAWADPPPDPLRLVPVQADAVVKIENPRGLVDNYTNLDIVQEVLKLDAVREALDSTNAHRLYQLIHYFEEKLGSDRYELLDKLAGGGVVFATKVAQPTPLI